MRLLIAFLLAAAAYDIIAVETSTTNDVTNNPNQLINENVCKLRKLTTEFKLNVFNDLFCV